VVLTGRKGKLVGTAPYDDIFNGKVFMGDEALKTGLVDQIGYQDDAYAYAAAAAGLSKPTVVKYQDNAGLLKLLTSESNVPAPEGKTVTIDGVKVELGQVMDLLSPRPLYLWCGE
jgi:protease-4